MRPTYNYVYQQVAREGPTYYWNLYQGERVTQSIRMPPNGQDHFREFLGALEQRCLDVLARYPVRNEVVFGKEDFTDHLPLRTIEMFRLYNMIFNTHLPEKT